MRGISLGVAVALITFVMGASTTGVWKYFTRKPIALACGPSHRIPTAEVNPVAEAELREIMRQFGVAQTKHDAAFFENIEADSFTVTTRSGETLTKADVIALMKTWDTTTKYVHEDLEVQVYGDVATVKGWMTASELSEGHTYRSRWQSLYLLTKRGGRWQFLSLTQIR